MSADYEDEVMEQSRRDFESRIVGRRIVSVEEQAHIEGPVVNASPSAWSSKAHAGTASLVLTLDNGVKVGLVENGACCAYTSLSKVVQNLPTMDHVITAVKADNERHVETWHVLAGMSDVLDIEIDWSDGTGYYAYGFEIVVQKEEA